MGKAKQIALGLLAVAMTIAAAFLLGALWQTGHLGNDLVAARTEAGIYKSAADASNQVIDRLQAREAKRLRDLRAQRDAANAALNRADRLQAKNDQLHRQLMAALRKTEHDNADCRAIAHVGLCPAVDRRLFPASASSSGDAVADP